MKNENKIRELKREIACSVIYEHFIVCLECGKKFGELTDEHLARHGLNIKTYRERHGYDHDMPLACRSLCRNEAMAVGM